MNIIIREVLNELNLDLREKYILYSESELNQIVDTLHKKHEFYGLGVTLNSKIHKLFHSIYLNGNNTPKQFEEFKTRLVLGEFNDFLDKNNLHLTYKKG